jgi:hypothetical protein
MVLGRARAHLRALDAAGPERSRGTRGLTQFVVGTGGREIINPKGTETRVAAQTMQPAAGALRLDLGRDDAAFSYATTDGTFTDSGTVPCRHPAPPDTTPPSVPTGVAARALSPTSAALSWTASSDAVGVAGYTVAVAASLWRPCRRPRRRTETPRWPPSVGTPGPSRRSTRRKPVCGVGRRDRDDAVRPAQQPQPPRRPAPRAGTGPRIHRGVLPRLAGRRTATAAARGRGPRRRGPATTAGREELLAHGRPMALAVRREVPDPQRHAGRRPRRPAARGLAVGRADLAPRAAPAARQRPRLSRDPGGGHRARSEGERPAGNRRTGCHDRRTGARTSPTGSP